MGRRSAAVPRREQVLRTAETLFARRGYAGVGLREIARRAGIRAPSLFKHFPGKRQLYNAALRGLFRDLLRVVREATGSGKPDPERLHDLVEAYIDFVLAHPTFPRIFFRVLLDHPRGVDRATQAIGWEIYDQLEGLLRAGTRAGAFRAVGAPHFWWGFTGAVAAFHASLPVFAGRKSIDLSALREQRRWKAEVWDMVSRFVLAA